jgi:hypothetical protein
MTGGARARYRASMWHVVRRTLGAVAVVLYVFTSTAVDTTEAQRVIQGRIPQGVGQGSIAYVRTELFFGTARPGGVVSASEFRAFVDAEVAPRFPHGFTLLEGMGQFRAGETVFKEASFLLVLLYRHDTLAASSQKIQRIRDLYEERFAQESVLRVDDSRVVWVSF